MEYLGTVAVVVLVIVVSTFVIVSFQDDIDLKSYSRQCVTAGYMGGARWDGNIYCARYIEPSDCGTTGNVTWCNDPRTTEFVPYESVVD